jgi:hypothetical protein
MGFVPSQDYIVSNMYSTMNISQEEQENTFMGIVVTSKLLHQGSIDETPLQE